jgi:hypothetical protein
MIPSRRMEALVAGGSGSGAGVAWGLTSAQADAVARLAVTAADDTTWLPSGRRLLGRRADPNSGIPDPGGTFPGQNPLYKGAGGGGTTPRPSHHNRLCGGD